MSRSRKIRRMEKAKRNLKPGYSLSDIGYIRINIKYPIHFVFRNFGHWKLKLFGHVVKMWSKRYETFKTYGVE